MVATEQQSLSRSALLRRLFQGLDDQDIRYCVLHSYESLPDELPSDLDLALHPDDFPKLPLVIRALRETGYIPVQCLNYGVKGHCFVFFWSEGMTFKSLAVDTICQYREGGLILMSGAELVTGRRKLREFWVPRPEMEFVYLLASKTLKRRVSALQAKRLQQLAAELGRPRAECVTASLFGESSKERIVDACVAGIGPGVLKEVRLHIWRAVLSRDPFNPVRYCLSDLPRRFRRWFQPTGLFLVVLGPDGVGKGSASR